MLLGSRWRLLRAGAGKHEASSLSLVLSDKAAELLKTRGSTSAAVAADANLTLSEVLACALLPQCLLRLVFTSTGSGWGADSRRIPLLLCCLWCRDCSTEVVLAAPGLQNWHSGGVSFDSLTLEDVVSIGLADGLLVDLSAAGRRRTGSWIRSCCCRRCCWPSMGLLGPFASYHRLSCWCLPMRAHDAVGSLKVSTEHNQAAYGQGVETADILGAGTKPVSAPPAFGELYDKLNEVCFHWQAGLTRGAINAVSHAPT